MTSVPQVKHGLFRVAQLSGLRRAQQTRDIYVRVVQEQHVNDDPAREGTT